MTPDQQPATKADLAQAIDTIGTLFASLREEFRERLDAAVVSIASDFSELRGEMQRTKEDLQLQIRGLENRLDTFGTVTLSMDARLTGMTRVLERIERDYIGLKSTQVAQQRAIDELVKRWTKGPQQ